MHRSSTNGSQSSIFTDFGIGMFPTSQGVIATDETAAIKVTKITKISFIFLELKFEN